MTSRDLGTLTAVFQAKARAWLEDCEEHGIDILITATYRSMEEQAAEYAKGRTTKSTVGPFTPEDPLGKIVTKAKPGESAHQWRMALDFVPMDNGRPVWDVKSPLWDRAIKLAEARGMESLRPFESAHLQEPGWRDKKP